MKDKGNKRVVIINDIDSGEIERAIFILRNGGAVQPAAYQIVTEAEKIIRAYSKTVGKEWEDADRPKKKSPGAWGAIAYGITVLFLVAVSGYGILRLLQVLS